LRYTADRGEVNGVRVALEDGPAGPVAYVVEDDAGVSAGGGCEATGSPTRARCAIPTGTAPAGPELSLRDRSDRVRIRDGRLHAGARTSGGSGNDVIRAGGLILGDRGNDFLARLGAGRVRMVGGTGDDKIVSARPVDDPSVIGDGSVIVPGRGRDVVRPGDGQLVRVRDGELDRILCQADGDATVSADVLDFPTGCQSVSRRGAARAVPLGVGVFDKGVSLEIGCPSDAAPRCVGRAWISDPRGTSSRMRFRLAPGETSSSSIRVPPRLLQRLRRHRVRVTVRSRTAGRRERMVSPPTPVTVVVEEPDE
jgi:hypothetical protein